ncbi:protein LATERAL ROOT PRIMORDIUM 1-like [Panicum miliaceum]|uniref:Protein LATERAL ROOT PRIMORDIUM 1-like n=1 Tax=Panicum miliaceum TaxID=4540 RepID=A0A3L6RFZ2_PANMI|nr:protein LATERAL ROOT PRIMORDIUM 1-like [Panicum miliaceum]
MSCAQPPGPAFNARCGSSLLPRRRQPQAQGQRARGPELLPAQRPEAGWRSIPARAEEFPRAASVASSSGRRFPSDATAIAGWLPSAPGGRGDDLSLGFNAGGSSASLAAGLWGPAASRQAAAAALGYGAVGAAASAADDPVFPLIAAAQRTLVDADAASGKPPASSAGAIQFWHPEPQAAAADGSTGKKALAMLDPGRGGAGSGSGAATCHDCGNQAKKGCAHNRCRTCCNSRGFDCETHVRSTWVPAARRRERLQLAGGGAGASPPPPGPAAAKKPRLACQTATATTNSRTSTSNATTPRSFDTTSSHQDASFKDNLPRQVRGPAVFRCVRVTSVDDGGGGGGTGEVAYQAAVTINGHLFRGLLYDHGADTDGRAAAAAADVQLGTSDLHLGSASAAAPNLYSGASAPLILGGLGYGNTP